MSQEAVERFLGRLMTDDTFRNRAEKSIADACQESGYELNAVEMKSISHDDIIRLGVIAHHLDKGIKRVSPRKRK